MKYKIMLTGHIINIERQLNKLDEFIDANEATDLSILFNCIGALHAIVEQMRLEDSEPPEVKTCEWFRIDTFWHTKCGHSPSHKSMGGKFCTYCGNEIKGE